MFLSLLAWFGTKTPPKPAPGTPEASLAARPLWAQSGGYAPAPPVSLLSKREEQPWIGELDGRMLSCEVETSHRGDRQRLFASFRDHDTTKPDMDVSLRIRGVEVVTVGPTDSATATFGAPAVTLDEGDSMQVILEDRGVLRKVVFDRLEGSYGGDLPQVLQGEDSTASCGVVPREEVEAALVAATPEADRRLANLEAREVQLHQEDFGRSMGSDPRDAIEDMAAIVGWERVEVSSRVQRVSAAERAFSEAIEVALRAEVERMPTSYRDRGLEVRSRGMKCPVFGYHRHGLHYRCVLELEVARAPGSPGFQPELMTLDGQGHGITGHTLPLSEAEDRRAQAEWRTVEEGEEALVVVLLSSSEPRVLRFFGEEGIQWMQL